MNHYEAALFLAVAVPAILGCITGYLMSLRKLNTPKTVRCEPTAPSRVRTASTVDYLGRKEPRF